MYFPIGEKGAENEMFYYLCFLNKKYLECKGLKTFKFEEYMQNTLPMLLKAEKYNEIYLSFHKDVQLAMGKSKLLEKQADTLAKFIGELNAESKAHLTEGLVPMVNQRFVAKLGDELMELSNCHKEEFTSYKYLCAQLKNADALKSLYQANAGSVSIEDFIKKFKNAGIEQKGKLNYARCQNLEALTNYSCLLYENNAIANCNESRSKKFNTISKSKALA